MRKKGNDSFYQQQSTLCTLECYKYPTLNTSCFNFHGMEPTPEDAICLCFDWVFPSNGKRCIFYLILLKMHTSVMSDKSLSATVKCVHSFVLCLAKNERRQANPIVLAHS